MEKENLNIFVVPMFENTIKTLFIFFIVLVLFFLSITPLIAHNTVNNDNKPLSVYPKEGVFHDDIAVIFNTDSKSDIFYTFQDSGQKEYTHYKTPLYLTALPGEKRVYTILAKMSASANENNENIDGHNIDTEYWTKSFTYTIDKRIPEAPSISPAPGIYDHDIKIDFTPTLWDIYYSVGDQDFLLWNKEPHTLTTDTYTQHVNVQAFTSSESNIISPLQAWNYILLKQPQKPQQLEILSPVHGSFYNNQLFYVKNSEKYEWIRYTLQDEDPVTRGASYQEPIIFRARGDFLLKVAALPNGTEEPLFSEVAFSIKNYPTQPVTVPSGYHRDTLYIPPPKFDKDIQWFFTLTGRSPTRQDSLLNDHITIKPPPSGTRYVTLRVIKYNKNISAQNEIEELTEFRYFYILDQQTPHRPLISLKPLPPASSPIQVSLFADKKSTIYYTIDGSTPGRYSSIYTTPFEIKPPDDTPTGSSLLKAVAYYPNNKSSAISSNLLTFDTEEPPPPEVLYNKIDCFNYIIKYQGEGILLYEVTYDGSEPHPPTSTSFRGKSEMELSIPRGYSGTCKMRFALVDRAGNISLATDVINIEIDTVPPKAPNFYWQNNELLITSSHNKESHTIHYEISKDGSNPNSVTRNSPQYNEPLKFQPEKGERVEIRVAAVAIDQCGNTGPIAFSDPLVIDETDPELPAFSGIEKNGIYNSPQTLKLHIPSLNDSASIYTEQAVRVLMTVSSEINRLPDIPPDPIADDIHQVFDLTSTDHKGSYTFHGYKGEIVHYIVKLLPVYNEKLGDITSINFAIDKKAPELPIIHGIKEGVKYNHPVQLIIPFNDIKEKEKKVYLLSQSVTDQKEITTFSNIEMFKHHGILLETAYTFSAPPAEKKIYSIIMAIIDKAGNYTIMPAPVTFSIDRTIPPKPIITGIEKQIHFSDPVELCLSVPNEHSEKNESGLKDNFLPSVFDLQGKYYIYYEYTTNSTLPSVPNNNSLLYDDTLTFADPGVYTLRARAKNSAGTFSKESAYATFSIDPKEIETPSISITRPSSGRGIISFIKEPGIDIFYSFDGTYFKEFTGPIPIGVPVEIFWYAKDKAGNHSITHNKTISEYERKQHLFTGVEDRGVYNTDITIKPVKHEFQNTVTHFEVSFNGVKQKEVTSMSPVFDQAVTFYAGLGEIQEVEVSFRRYSEEHGLPLETQSVHFTIDKAPPPVPTITGANDGDYLQAAPIIELNAPEGDIYYTLMVNDMEMPIDSAFKLYTKPLEISTEKGEFSKIRLIGYTQDQVGNKSRHTEITFSVDKEIIYLSKEGDDAAAGTRNAPFKTLKRAFIHAQETGRNTIFMQRGEYSITQPLLLADNKTIIGGLNADWLYEGGTTLITPSFPRNRQDNHKNDALIIATGKQTRLEHLTLTNAGLLAPVIIFNSSESTLADIRIVHAGRNYQTAVKSTNSTISFNSVKIESAGLDQGKLLQFFSTDYTFRDVSVTDTGKSGDIILGVFTDSNGLIDTGLFSPGNGRRTLAVHLVRGSLQTRNSQFHTGSGTLHSGALLIENATFSAQNSRFESNNETWVSTLFQADKSHLVLSNSQLFMRAESGASGLRLSDGSLEIYSSRMYAEKTKDFISFIRLNNNAAQVIGSFFKLPENRDAVMFQAENSDIKIAFSTLFQPTGKAFVLNNKADLLVENSVLLSTMENKSILCDVSRNNQAYLKHNLMFGWNAILKSHQRTIEAPNIASFAEHGLILQNNISERPEASFVEPGHDFRLRPGSRGIDYGRPGSWIPENALYRDIDEVRRPQGNNYDIGAFEASRD